MVEPSSLCGDSAGPDFLELHFLVCFSLIIQPDLAFTVSVCVCVLFIYILASFTAARSKQMASEDATQTVYH